MGPMPPTPEPLRPEHDGGPLPIGGGAGGGAGTGTGADPLGQTRVTFMKQGHRFEFRCDGGQEAVLARAVLEFARRPGSPLEAGDAFALCRQIESMSKQNAAPGKPGADSSSSSLSEGGQEGRRKAA